MSAFDAVLGTKQWTFQPDNLVVSSSNPAVANGFIYFGCYDKKIYALYVVSGAKKWDYLTTDSVKSSPVVSNGLLYIASGGKLLCLDAISGVKKWDALIGFSISAPGSPVVANNMVYIGGSVKIMAFDAATGDKKWDFTTGGSKSSVVVAGNTLYMGAKNKKLYALDAITGEKKWELLTNNAIDSSPIVVIGSKAYYPSVSGMVQ